MERSDFTELVSVNPTRPTWNDRGSGHNRGSGQLDTTTPQGNLLFTIFAGLSQFERDLIRQRTKSGLEAARARGRKGGRPKASSGKVETALKMYDSKLHTIEEISTTTGISRATIYRYIEDREKRTAQ